MALMAVAVNRPDPIRSSERFDRSSVALPADAVIPVLSPRLHLNPAKQSIRMRGSRLPAMTTNISPRRLARRLA